MPTLAGRVVVESGDIHRCPAIVLLFLVEKDTSLDMVTVSGVTVSTVSGFR